MATFFADMRIGGVAQFAQLSGSLTADATAAPAAGSSSVSFAGGAVVSGSMVPAAGNSTVAFATGDYSVVVPAAGSSSVLFAAAATAAASMTPAAGRSTVAFTGEAVGSSGGGTVIADPGSFWAFMLPNGKSAMQTLLEVHTMLSELHKIHGLQPDSPLVVGQTSRVAGSIVQTINEAAGVVTVSRPA